MCGNSTDFVSLRVFSSLHDTPQLHHYRCADGVEYAVGCSLDSRWLWLAMVLVTVASCLGTCLPRLVDTNWLQED